MARAGILAAMTLLGASALVVLPVVGNGRSSVAGAVSDPVLVVAGDISCGPTDANFAGGNAADCQQRATANLVASLNPDYLLPGGDTQYTPSESEGQQPLSSDYTSGYGASWGQLQNPSSGNYVPGLVVRPTPGDHEYGDANENDMGLGLSDASNYYSYFGGLGDLPAGVSGPSTDFYSFDVPVNGGTWHIVSLDSECAALPATSGGGPSGSAAGCAPGSPQETFFNHDLATHQGECTLIHWHEPEWSEGANGNSTDYQAFWNDAYQYHVTAIVNGHDHDYERWMPLNASGNPDPNGVNQIIAGTGGNSHGLEFNPSGSVVHDDFSHFGVLELTLHAGSADFAFKTTSGTTPDSGTITCDPVVSGVSASSGPLSGGNTVTVTGSNFVGTPTVHFGSNLATNVSVTSPSTLTAKVPSGTAGTVDVTVTNAPPTGVGGPGPTSPTGAADQYTYGLVPTVTSVSPNGGSPSGGTSVTVSGTNLGGATAVDFGANPATNVVVNGGGTSLTATSPAGALGAVDVTVTTSGGTSATSSADRFTYQKSGYWMVGNDGGVFSFGGAPFEGSVPSLGIHLNSIVAMVPTADSKGYWMIGSDGGVFAFGDAGFVGSIPGLHIHLTDIVGAVPTADGKGYWMIGSDGGVFAFGDAGFVGSIPGLNIHVNNIVAVVPTADNKGYWMIGSDGGVFAFGDAGFVGSLPGINVHVKNIVGAVPTSDGKGYWMVGNDGGVFAFGDAGFVGSLPGLNVHISNIVGVVATQDGRGYWMVGNDGGVFAFGDAGFVGSLPGLNIHVNNIVAFARQ